MIKYQIHSIFVPVLPHMHTFPIKKKKSWDWLKMKLVHYHFNASHCQVVDVPVIWRSIHSVLFSHSYGKPLTSFVVEYINFMYSIWPAFPFQVSFLLRVYDGICYSSYIYLETTVAKILPKLHLLGFNTLVFSICYVFAICLHGHVEQRE